MARLLEFLLVITVPLIVFWSALKAMNLLSEWDGRLWRRRSRIAPTGPSLQRLVDDLRRLEGVYCDIEGSDPPAKAARLRAVSLAYDDTLRACCRALDLSEPESPPLDPVVRLQTEAALAQSGLRW